MTTVPGLIRVTQNGIIKNKKNFKSPLMNGYINSGRQSDIR